MNTKYRLQVCSHPEVFQTRDAAMSYINRYFMPDNLIGEPTFYFYGDNENPNLIVAVGLGDRKYTTVDLGLTNEHVDEITETLGSDNEKLEKAIATIKGVISSTGLEFDTNKVEDQVSYKPDVKDELIGEAKTLADAIDVLSKYVQEKVKSTNLLTEDSKSIDLIYEPSADGNGMSLKAAIKISKHGDDDENDDNDNIIGLKSDGIYATVNVKYDDEKNELSFVTSGVKNGKFMDDANKKVINLGKHTQYTPDNNGYNVELVVDKTHNTISGNVKLSEDENNILKVQDEKLFVDGRASNIKYKEKTVYAGLNNLESIIETISDDLETLKEHVEKVENHDVIVGDTTDTMVITATKQSTGGYQISGGVRLGADKTIIHKDGGLEADIEITSDIARNKLIVRTGSITKEVDLPSVDFIDNAYYDSVTQEIVIEFNNGNTVRIPMTGLITTYMFENNTSSPVVFHVSDKTRSTEKVVTTSFKLASNDNILSVNGNGELIAPKSVIDDAVSAEKADRIAEDTKLSETIQAEIARATSAEKVNADAISVNTKAIADVNAKVETNTAAIGILNADDTTDGSVKYFAKHAYDLAVEKVNTEQLRAEGVENSLSERIYELEGKVTDTTDGVLDKATRYADAKIAENYTQVKTDISNAKSEVIATAAEDATAKSNAALTSAKEYTDDELAKKYTTITDDIRIVKEEAISTASDDATSKSDKALADAKSYTDAAIEKINTNEEELVTSISELKAKDTELENELKNKIEKVEIVKNSQNDLQYTLQVDGVPVSEINIPKDQFLKEASYNTGSKSLVFVFVTSEGETTTSVDISDLVDTYTAGDGLTLADNKFSIRKATLSEGYLTVTPDGISINGIDAAIATLNDTINAKSSEAQQNAVDAASVDATSKADKALADAKTYADNGLALKANISDVYTKTEINEKGFLTSSDLSNYALKTDVVAETNRAQAAEKINADAIDGLEDRTLTIENNVSLLQAEDKRLNLIPVETNGLRINVSKADSGTTISGDVKLNTNVDNIIKMDSNGLHSSIALNYNKAENSLELVVNGNGRGAIVLSDHSLVQEGHYDSSTQSIVLTIVKDGGETQQISIPVGDIINEWVVDNGINNPISLSKTTGSNNVDVLKAELEISTESHNAILNNNGTLYVSNQAKDLTTNWAGTGEITIQLALENLRAETDKIEGVVEDVNDLKTDMTQIKNDITVLQGDVNTLEDKVNQNTSDIATNKASITTLTENVSNLSEKVTNVSNDLNELNTKIENYDNRISKIEENVSNIQENITNLTQDIKNIQNEIGMGTTGGETLISRLEKLEEQINNLIDFGNFS